MLCFTRENQTRPKSHHSIQSAAAEGRHFNLSLLISSQNSKSRLRMPQICYRRNCIRGTTKHPRTTTQLTERPRCRGKAPHAQKPDNARNITSTIGTNQEDAGGYLHGSRVQEERRQSCRGRYLEVDVGAGREDWAELGVLLDGPPLMGYAPEQGGLRRRAEGPRVGTQIR